MKSFLLSTVVFIILMICFTKHSGIGNNHYDLIPIAKEAKIYAVIAKQYQTYGLIQTEGEAKIYGRLARTRIYGAFSDGALLGFCNKVRNIGSYATYLYQVSSYQDGNCYDYLPYQSQSGGQGLIYSFLDKLNRDPIILKMFCATFFSAVLVAWFLWLHSSFGLIPALLIMSGTLCLRGLIIFGDNISQILGATYLIMIALFWAHKKRIKKIGTATFFVVLLKLLLNGPEYIFCALLLPFLPLVFYSILYKTSNQRVIKTAVLITGSILLACLVALLILLTQDSIALPSPTEAIHHFINRLLARTYAPNLLPEDGTGIFSQYLTMNISIFQLLHLYLSMPCINIASFQVSFQMIILFFFMISILTFYLYRCLKQRILLALLVTTWSSILCPLSWIVIAKGHSASHTFIDQLVWHMPFTLLGMALTVVTLQTCIKKWGPE